jgi:hypothetical protein
MGLIRNFPLDPVLFLTYTLFHKKTSSYQKFNTGLLLMEKETLDVAKTGYLRRKTNSFNPNKEIQNYGNSTL